MCPALQIDTLNSIKESLLTKKPLSFDDCIVWARLKFQELFHDMIKQLLYNFPPDQVTSSGAPFWSGPKRCPSVHVFDADNEMHMEFLVAAANLRAQVYGLKGETDRAVFLKVLPKIEVPAFEPAQGVKIETDEKKAEEAAKRAASATADADAVHALVAELPVPSSLAGFKLEAHEFEKDDPTNFHMDFITATSNLRATCYSIEPADKHKVRTDRIAAVWCHPSLT